MNLSIQKPSKNSFKKKKTNEKVFISVFISNEDSIWMSRILPPNAKTVQLKQIHPITSVYNLLLCYTVFVYYATIDLFTICAFPYNLTMSNSLVFSFFTQ